MSFNTFLNNVKGTNINTTTSRLTIDYWVLPDKRQSSSLPASLLVSGHALQRSPLHTQHMVRIQKHIQFELDIRVATFHKRWRDNSDINVPNVLVLVAQIWKERLTRSRPKSRNTYRYASL